jgi:hypothetical protein
MTITRFEYETFTLSNYTSTASKYKRICDDYHDNQGVNPYSALMQDMERRYSVSELELTDKDERDYWIHTLGKQAGIQLVTSSRVDSETMMKLSCLDDEGFEQAILVCTKIARELDRKVKAAENLYQKENTSGFL